MEAGEPASLPRGNWPAAAWHAHFGVLDRLRGLLAVCEGSRIRYLNQAGARLLGLAQPQDALGICFFSFVHRDYAPLAELGLGAFAEEPLVMMKLLGAAGTSVDVELAVTRLAAGSDPPCYLLEAHDLTEHLRVARALRLREQRLEGVINTVADGVITLDAHGVIQRFNPAAEMIFGFDKSEVIGRHIQDLVPEAPFGVDEGRGAGRPAPLATKEIVGLRRDGETMLLEMAVRELLQGEHLSFTAVVRDISARKAAEERVLRKAYYDALTELPNRHLLADRVEEAFKRARRHVLKLALLFIDLDKFKPINDSFGHAVGDRVLKGVASRLKAGVRATDTVARVGGDEFMVLLEELSSVFEAEDIRQKLHEMLADPFVVEGHQIAVSASIGVAIYPDHGLEFAQLMDYADRNMYRQKQAEARTV